MKCVICEAEMRPWLKIPWDPKRKEVLENFEAVYCHQCHVGSINPMPSPDVVARAYELDSYYTQGESHLSIENPRFMDKVLLKLAWLLDKGTPTNTENFRELLPVDAEVLDVGSGAGDKLHEYLALGYHATGVEMDENALSLAGQATGIEMYKGTAESIPRQIQGKSFDLISMTHVLEHCISPNTAVSNMRDLLKQDGYFWCEVPNVECKHFKKFNICSEMFDAPRHLHFFTTDSLTALIEKSGFEVIHVYYHGFCRHFSAAWRRWEQQIARDLKELKVDTAFRNHNLRSSFALLLSSLFSTPRLKYDCVGVIARRL